MKFALLLCAVTTVASAQPAPDDKPVEDKPETRPADSLSKKIDTKKIEQLFDDGTKHYDLGEWDKAIESFKHAYALMPDPSFLFNLGQAYKQKGACRDAKAAYVAYLRKAPDEDRTKVEGFIHELEPCLKIEEEKARRLLPPPQLSPRHRKLRLAGLVTAGAGLGIAGIGAYYGYRALDASADLERCNDTPCEPGVGPSIDAKGRAAERRSIIFGATGGLMLATGVSLYLYTKLRGEYVQITPAPGGAIATARLQF